jgi:hypothetical protein
VYWILTHLVKEFDGCNKLSTLKNKKKDKELIQVKEVRSLFLYYIIYTIAKCPFQ